MTPTTRTLEERVARLERQNRRLTGAAVVAAGALAGAIALARQPAPSVVEAERFVVRDTKGRERAVLGMDHPTSPDHSPIRLALYNHEQHASAILYLSDAFGGLVVSSGAGDGERRAQLFANPKEGAGLGITAGSARRAVQLGADAHAAAHLVLEDGTGKVLFRAP